MACTLKTIMETNHILHYLLLMHKLMVPVEDGQLSIKMKLFLLLPLLAVHKGRSPTLLKEPQRDLSAPPGTPYPHRKAQEERKQRREDLVPPPLRRHLRYDDGDDDENNNNNSTNKENLPPQYPYDPKDEDRKRVIWGYLFHKWAEDIAWYQKQVLEDLQDLKLRLGIPQ
ncbi:E4 [Gammapapillomavirus 22]|uniref:E4 n=1 Tax=Gammapapillomavirus 22 TaxID=1961679 RepID=A0A2D2AM19_9PAPI|nr:E4 [Gammapapillomavirus 22]